MLSNKLKKLSITLMAIIALPIFCYGNDNTITTKELDTLLTTDGVYSLTSDLNGDGQQELVVFQALATAEGPEVLYSEYTINVYHANNDGAQLITSIGNKELGGLKPSPNYAEKIKKNKIPGFNNNNMLSVVTANAQKQVILLPVFFNRLYAVKILSFNNNQLTYHGELSGLELLLDVDKDGNVDFIGKEIQSDAAYTSKEQRTYQRWHFGNKETMIKNAPITKELYKQIANTKFKNYKDEPSIETFTDAFYFQFLHANQKVAVKWFKKNKVLLLKQFKKNNTDKAFVTQTTNLLDEIEKIYF